MRIKVHSSELNRMVKAAVRCVDARGIGNGNIGIRTGDGKLTVSGSGYTMSVEMSIPYMSADDESLLVDGAVFGNVCARCAGEVEIVSDGKTCTVRSMGRTRIPVIDGEPSEIAEADGKTVEVRAEDFQRAFRNVGYAISADDSRQVLTGAMVSSDGSRMEMVALDGFQMSEAVVPCGGEAAGCVIPGAFLRLVADNAAEGETIRICIGDSTVTVETDGMRARCGKMTGQFPEWQKIFPADFRVLCEVKRDDLMGALKNSTAVNSKQKLIRVEVDGESMKVMSNSEQADYEAEIPCRSQGGPLKIAFNEKYLMNLVGAVEDENVILRMNSPVSPVVVLNDDGSGKKLTLPVRIQGV